LSEKDKPFTVRELDLIFEEIGIEISEPIATEMDIDWSTAFQQIETLSPLEDENEILKVLDTAEMIQNEVQTHNKLHIPKPKFLAPKSLETMALLEDISELGDHREIPYLKLLLEKEHSPIVRQRIEGLITSFATSPAENNFKITKLEPGYSVFHELFKNSDVESKLLLLHEVAAVGDEKELPLLDSLMQDPSDIVRKRAALTLKSLNARLLKEVHSETSEPAVAPIPADKVILDNGDQSSKEGKESLLDIPFELEKTGAFPIKNKKKQSVQTSGGTLFDRNSIHYRNKNSFGDMSKLMASPLAPSITIIAPAYNEGMTIVENIRSLMSLRYVNYEVMVVNDGSKDDTLQKMIDAYDLVKIEQEIDPEWKSKPIRGIYKSPHNFNYWNTPVLLF